MYIFIDIDGVFIREDTPNTCFDTKVDENDVPIFESECIQPFVQVISAYDQVKIVISSSWREIFDFKTICSRFPKSIHHKIVGMTPLFRILDEDIPRYVRHQEVLEYLKTVGAEHEDWIAIDDLSEHYPPYVNIVVTNSYVGFDNNSALQLNSLLQQYYT